MLPFPASSDGEAVLPGPPGDTGPLSRALAPPLTGPAVGEDGAIATTSPSPGREDSAGERLVPVRGQSLLRFIGGPVTSTGRVVASSAPGVFWLDSGQGRVLVRPTEPTAVPPAGATVTVTGLALGPGADPDHPLPPLSVADVAEVSEQLIYIKASAISSSTATAQGSTK